MCWYDRSICRLVPRSSSRIAMPTPNDRQAKTFPPSRREFIGFAGSISAGALAATTVGAIPLPVQLLRTSEIENSHSEQFVYFVARTPYDTASGRYIKKLKSDSVLKWFQEHWNSGNDPSRENILGAGFYGLSSMFEGSDPKPTSLTEVTESLKKRCYYNSIVARDGAIEFLTDDDELDLSYYWFTSEFAAKHPDRVSFLMNDRWLPTNVVENEKSKPTTYLCSRYPGQSCDSANWDLFEIPGTRLEFIANVEPVMEKSKFSDSSELQDFLLKVPGDFSWKQTIEKLVAEKAAFKDNQTEFRCSKHICEMRHHAENWGKNKLFNHFVVFDDLWAATHPNLTASIRRFKKREMLFDV